MNHFGGRVRGFEMGHVADAVYDSMRVEWRVGSAEWGCHALGDLRVFMILFAGDDEEGHVESVQLWP